MMKIRRQERISTVAGFSLVEFMVAMVLGLIVVGGAVSVYLTSKNSFTEAEQVAEIGDNARFSLQLMATSARHIGFFGGPQPGDLQADTNLDDVTDDCTGWGATYGTSLNPLQGLRAIRATSGGTNPDIGCITDAVAGTDILIIKGVIPDPLYDADPADPNEVPDGVIDPDAWNEQEVYVVANSVRGMLVDGADTPPSVSEGDDYAFAAAWRYRMQIYYVRDGAVPTLSRKVLAWDSTSGTMGIETQDLVQGVEDMRFLFSFDSDNNPGNGITDSLGDLDAVDAAGAWDTVTAVQAYYLLQAGEGDPGYVNNRTYQLGDTTVTVNDNLRRILLQQEVTLRNPRLFVLGGPS